MNTKRSWVAFAFIIIICIAALFNGTVPGSTGNNTQNFSGYDIAWMLVSTALVMIMTPGLAFFYGGMVSKMIQVNAAAADAVVVVASAVTARLLAPKALPALNPNQPNHSSPVPSNTYVMRAGL